MDVELRIDGLAGLLEKERTVGAKTEGVLTDRLLDVGERVADDVRHRYVEYSKRGADGVEAKVFTSGLWVVQTLRKSRVQLRRRPNFGPLMMRKAFLPAQEDHQQDVLAAGEAAIAIAQFYWDKEGI